MNYKIHIKIVALVLILLCPFIHPQQSECLNGNLLNYNFGDKQYEKITLPKKLNEISGLTVTLGGRIFSHNDETGTVYEIDIETGKILNKFYLGKKKLKKDFEGIAAVNDSLFLVTSAGVLYRFNYTDDEHYVKYIKIKTFLSSRNNVEGLCFDKATNSLFLTCKDYPEKKLNNYKAIYSFDLITYKLKEEPRFLINLDYLEDKFDISNFSPTGIVVHPKSGNIFILSSHEKAIVELSSSGELLNAVKLRSKNHKQPEGIAFLSDLTLIISDEGKEEGGKVTLITLKSNHR